MAGAIARFVLGAVSGEALVATIAVNAGGSFLLAALLFGVQSETDGANGLRYLLGTGFFASFTTYSTFVADIALHEPVVALGYFLASYASGFVGVLLGRASVLRLRGGVRG